MVVRTGHKDIKATAYKKNGKTLIILASWARETVECSLQIDWQVLGLDHSKTTLYAPQVKSAMPKDKENIQDETRWKPGDKVTVSPGKGWLIYLEKI